MSAIIGDENLARFVKAQDQVYPRALAEMRAGSKRSHWMWYIFPQLRGLGHSAMAVRYGIESLAEARAYLAHPVLGARYRECVAALQALPETTAVRVMGPVDAVKLRSSLTLFEAAAAEEALFGAALERWHGGERDPATLALLAHEPPADQPRDQPKRSDAHRPDGDEPAKAPGQHQ